MHILANTSRSKENQAIVFGQKIEYYERNIFRKNYEQNMFEENIPFLKMQTE